MTEAKKYNITKATFAFSPKDMVKILHKSRPTHHLTFIIENYMMLRMLGRTEQEIIDDSYDSLCKLLDTGQPESCFSYP